MSSRNIKPAVSRTPVAPLHRGPQAMSATAPQYGGHSFVHAPNAALLIDFDNVTMGIRSDLGNELRNLLSSDIIKGKVAVQRAYADWRRYPQYIVPLTEASIDLIFAPAYGSSKKNATDIRLAVDAIELVFSRPEIGTFILLSGDSDFSSLVVKLKEYGKYVIGVGIRESSSDLLVMNCDEYYSYNALAGLVKAGEDEKVARDPWELVVEAVSRMKRNGDVMRSDRLKQVMQEIDDTFDEKNLGMAKFSRFVQEASQRGLLKITRLDNGQMEVDVAESAAGARPAEPRERVAPVPTEREGAPEEAGGRRGRRGRGRGRDRGPRPEPTEPVGEHFAPPIAEPVAAAPAQRETEMTGERLTRDEALDLVRRAVLALTQSPDVAVPARDVRRKARELLGRDSESLNERFFHRILRDAHDADLVDLRKHGDDYEVAPAAPAAPIAEQLAAAAPAPAPGESSQAARSAANAAALRRGIRPRGRRGGELPPELLAIGVVESPPIVDLRNPSTEPVSGAPEPATAAEPAAGPVADTAAAENPRAERAPRRGRGGKTAKTATRGRGRKTAAKNGAAAAPAAPPEAKPEEAAPPKPRRSRARKKTAASAGGEG
ncbi:MAG TPA: NYN domain-containing protein [Gemmatimonadaceae bacterium]